MFCFSRPLCGVLAGLATASIVTWSGSLVSAGRSAWTWISYVLW